MQTYKFFWRGLHLFVIVSLGYHILTSFMPAIELWHPVDIEAYHFKYTPEMDNDPIWSPDGWGERSGELFGNPELLEMEQVEREIEPHQSGDLR